MRNAQITTGTIRFRDSDHRLPHGFSLMAVILNATLGRFYA
jgi:hypothetical protein